MTSRADPSLKTESVLAASVAMTSFRLATHDQLSPAAPGKVLVLGGAFVDKTLSLRRLPPVGGDSYAQELFTGVGGCALNVAHILRQLELPHSLKVPLGIGPNTAIIEAQLKADGYNDASFIKPYRPTDSEVQDCGYCLCLLDAQRERTFIVVPGLENNIKAKWLESVDFASCDLIYLSGFDLTEDNGMVYLQEIAARKRPDCAVYFDAGARVDFITAEARALLFSLNPILHLNQMELELLTGTKDLTQGVALLTTKTQSPVVVTLAGQGCLLAQRLGRVAHGAARRTKGALPGALPAFGQASSNDQEQALKPSYKNIFHQAMAQAPAHGFVLKHYPTKAVPVVDATGAGDAHSAGMIAALMQGQTIDEGIIYGSKLSAKAVGQLGARLTLNAAIP